MEENLKCLCCDEMTEYVQVSHFIRYHLKKIHNLTAEQYYISYLQKDVSESICKNPKCDKTTHFISLQEGFRKYCSNQCTQTDPEFLKSREENYLKKTGFKHPRQNPELQTATENKNLKNMGVRTYFQTSDFKRKRRETLKQRYGSEEFFNSEEFKKFFELNKDEIYKKSRISLLENYGVDNPMKLKDILEKRNQNNLNLYGVKNVFELPQIKDLIKRTNLEKYGFENHNSNENQKQKKRDVYQRLSKSQKEVRILNITKAKYEQFLDIINPIFNQGYTLVKYDVKGKHELKCPLNHLFEIQGQLLIDRVRRPEIICSQCNHIIKPYSLMEKELFQFIKSNCDFEVKENVFGLVDERLELDVYIPELNLGFEFNGLFWHNENNKGTLYHLNKTDLFENEGIQIIHIYEDDWNLKKEIVKSRILNILGKTQNKIYARQCELREVSFKHAELFLNDNHIQGNVVSKYRYGLYYENELVSLMTFGKTRSVLGYKKNDSHFELLRFCNKLNTNVVGGASKLFKHFIKTCDFEKIISYADRSWSQGNLYEKLGFSFIKATKPNYWYVIDGVKQNRWKFTKYKLIKRGFDVNKSEKDIMRELKIYRIYDSGSLLFEYTK